MTPVVVLDACVLYPAAQRDLFMWLAARGVIRAHWTNEIHDEWLRDVERDYGIARSVLERVRKLMDRADGDALIKHYRQHEHLFAKTDAKDRNVAAAAVAARKRSKADIVTIITWNLRDFDRNELAKAGVAAETPDAFLCRLFAKSPEEVITAFVRMQNNLRNPSKTAQECDDTRSTNSVPCGSPAVSGSTTGLPCSAYISERGGSLLFAGGTLSTMTHSQRAIPDRLPFWFKPISTFGLS